MSTKMSKRYILASSIKKLIDAVKNKTTEDLQDVEHLISAIVDEEFVTEIPPNKMIRIDDSMVFVQLTDFKEFMLFVQLNDVYEEEETKERDGSVRLVLSCVNDFESFRKLDLYYIIELVENKNSPFFVPAEDYMEEINKDGYQKIFK